MFEATLLAKLKKVFELDRVRFDSPSQDGETHSLEQETLFVEIDIAKNTFKDGVAHAKVTGKATIYAQHEKLPFGYFAKCIASHPDETKDIFFFDIEENARLHHNLVQRGFGFVYFFSGQYDPAIGTITSITTEVTT